MKNIEIQIGQWKKSAARDWKTARILFNNKRLILPGDITTPSSPFIKVALRNLLKNI
jgi:hypothetical protein